MTEPKVIAYTLFPSCKGDERRYDVVEEHLTAKATRLGCCVPGLLVCGVKLHSPGEGGVDGFTVHLWRGRGHGCVPLSFPSTHPLTSSQAPMSRSRSSKMGSILPSAVGPTLRSRLLQEVGVGVGYLRGWGTSGVGASHSPIARHC